MPGGGYYSSGYSGYWPTMASGYGYGSSYYPANGYINAGYYAGNPAVVGYSSAYVAPGTTAPVAPGVPAPPVPGTQATTTPAAPGLPAPPVPGTQTQPTQTTPAPFDPNEHPSSFQPTGQSYQPPGDSRHYAVYRDLATGKDVYFPNPK